MPQKGKRPKAKNTRTKPSADAQVTITIPVVPEQPKLHSNKLYPKIESDATPEEISKLGTRDFERLVSDKPNIKKTKGMFNEMEFVTQVEKYRVRQPYLNEAEVVKLGTKHWWPYRNGDFTTIVNGHRFLVTPANFQDFKDKGLLIGCDVSDAPKYRS